MSDLSTASNVSVPLVIDGDRVQRVLVPTDRHEDDGEDRVYYRADVAVCRISLASLALGAETARKEAAL